MLPFGIQPLHLVIIAVVALLIFGPSRLPDIGRGIGKALKEFQRGTKEMGEGFKEEVTKPVEDPSAAPAQPPAAYSQSVPQPLPQPIPQSIPHVNVAQPVQQNAAQPSWQAASPAEAQPVAAAGNFCNSCGSSNPAGARFCNKCGSPI
jgi:TatA/E family protein of Tat protein translocase